ncbi:hypothetical protein [Demequina flava]|uniref:hypothetical protein n=1 Tax=Demequina flava TaxID=1095025 RepID=UPI0007829E43|nr:hypothetical protein [Demequina flava]
MASIEAWSNYSSWNDAVAAIIYPEAEDAGPSYLDLEDDILAEIAKAANWSGDPVSGLRDAVAGVVVSSGRLRLNTLTVERRVWMRDANTRKQPPPILAFLAMTVVAAEQMGADDSPYAKNAYYPQLAAALGLATDKASLSDVQKHYSARAEDYWGALNWWLEECDGARGLPTAYALSHRYVGLPLSQALVRDGDRKKFIHFFVKYGLAPGMEIAGADLEGYLGEWFSLESCPASMSLKKLWSRDSTRARIADVVALELAGWDGSVDSTDSELAQSQGTVRLLADLHEGFFGSNLELMLLLNSRGASANATALEVRDSKGDWSDIEAVAGASTTRIIPTRGTIAPASVVSGIVELRESTSDGLAPLRRDPRFIVPLVFDELQQAFVERERLQLNSESILLVDEGCIKGTGLGLVEQTLEAHARPGWQKRTGVEGVPEGWALFTDVQMFTPPLENLVPELVPLARGFLTLGGGIKIPSRIRKWSVKAPPEIRVSLEQVPSLEIRMSSLKTDTVVRTWNADHGAAIVELSSEQLAVGDYRIELYVPGQVDPVQQVTLRLRTGGEQEPVSSTGDVLACSYRVGPDQAARGAVGMEVSPESDVTASISGLWVEGGELDVEVAPAPATAPWMRRTETNVVSEPSVALAESDPKSCVRTGAHYLEYPVFGTGPKLKYISGECKYCGVVKRSPGWAWKATKVAPQAYVEQKLDVSDLPTVDEGKSRLWAGALDAVQHLGSGKPSALDYVATQIEPGSLFRSTFVEALEQICAIDIERDATGAVVRWSVPEAQLAVRPNTESEPIGSWPQEAWEWLIDSAGSEGALLSERANEVQPPRSIIENVPESVLEVAFEHGIGVVDDPAWQLTQVLPSISSVGGSLPRVKLPGFVSAEFFDTVSASWVATTDVDRAGAFRLIRGFERMYIWREASDVGLGHCARGPASLVKYVAATDAGHPLATYHADSAAIMVPRGCNLPGLYARAAVVSSGRLPRPARISVGKVKRRVSVYTNVDRPTADWLLTLLCS